MWNLHRVCTLHSEMLSSCTGRVHVSPLLSNSTSLDGIIASASRDQVTMDPVAQSKHAMQVESLSIYESSPVRHIDSLTI
jgi:tRNA(Phe) wybutosine-synthesizing methylase Tyw3